MTDDARTLPFPGLKVVRHFRRDVSHHFDFLHFFRQSACSFVWLSVILAWFALGCSEDRYHQYEFEREPFADKDLDPDETPELEENETDLDLESDQADPPDTSEETPNDIIVLCEESLQYCGDDPLFFDGTERCEKLETEEGGLATHLVSVVFHVRHPFPNLPKSQRNHHARNLFRGLFQQRRRNRVYFQLLGTSTDGVFHRRDRRRCRQR